MKKYVSGVISKLLCIIAFFWGGVQIYRIQDLGKHINYSVLARCHGKSEKRWVKYIVRVVTATLWPQNVFSLLYCDKALIIYVIHCSTCVRSYIRVHTQKDRHTSTHTHTHTHTHVNNLIGKHAQTQRQTDRQLDRQTKEHIHTHTHTHPDSHTYPHTNTNNPTGKHAQTVKHTGRQTGRQTDKQTHIHRHA